MLHACASNHTDKVDTNLMHNTSSALLHIATLLCLPVDNPEGSKHVGILIKFAFALYLELSTLGGVKCGRRIDLTTLQSWLCRMSKVRMEP